MRVYDVIKRPVLSEKSYAGIEKKKYVFEVALDANKTEIKKAVENIFGVSVLKVNTVSIKGKVRNLRKTRGTTQLSDIKKAYVELTADSKPIEFFEGVK